MNGPQHFKAAEHLLDMAEDEPEVSAITGSLLGAAQVHATLALAAATAAEQATRWDGDEAHERTRGWAGVA